MIAPEQLAQALDRIDPHDRELLSLSLRRRVPDEALGRVLAIDSGEVSRRRARAIERLADELDLQRGEDLGAVLKALLEPDTWNVAAAGLGQEFAAGARAGGAPARLAAVPLPSETPEPPPSEPGEPAPVPADPPPAPALAPVPEPADRPAEPPGAGAEVEPAPADQPAPAEPVLDMLAGRDDEPPDSVRRPVVLALFGLGIAALVGAAGIVGATQFGDSDDPVERGGGGGDDGTRHFIPAGGGPLAAPFPTDPQTISCYSTAYVRRPTALYREPGGRRLLTITARTEWSSPRVLGVVSQRGDWLGVQAPELKNGEVGWMRRSEARVDCSRWSLHADLSRRLLFVRRDGRTKRKMTVAIGRSGNPTPTGRFTVTDKLKVTDSSSPYGCCVLALSGHQTRLPASWTGGDRLAVHATSDRASIGEAVSLGCLRAQEGQMRWLLETVPLGAPIFIRA